MKSKLELLEIAAKALNTDLDDIKKNCKELPEMNAYYFWTSGRGGISIIINADGEKLRATSRVSLERHIEAFKNGKRN